MARSLKKGPFVDKSLMNKIKNYSFKFPQQQKSYFVYYN